MQLSCSLTFSILYCLGFHPITCHILVNNLHFITSKLTKSHLHSLFGLVMQQRQGRCCVTRPNNGCKGDYSKHGTNAVYFCLKLFRQQGLFHINWKEFICPLLKDIFVGNFESLGYFYVSKLEKSVTQSVPLQPTHLKKITCMHSIPMFQPCLL